MKNPPINKYTYEFKKITEELLSPTLDYYDLTQAIEEWKKILFELTALDLNEASLRENIHSESGKAIGTTWAAMCLDDIVRTKRFIKGIFHAVEDLMKIKKSGPVNILYAGTGPFAPFVLLLTTRYTSQNLQFTLLEINQNSIESVKTVFKKLNLEEYVTDLIQCDATRVQISDPEKIDLLISETMQHALVREQQVPITFNLLSQLKKDVVLIPERIELHLGLISTKRNQQRMNSFKYEKPYYRLLNNFYNLDKPTFFEHQTGFNSFSRIFRFPTVAVDLSPDLFPLFNFLTVFTRIIIYKEELLDIHDCPLTAPLLLEELKPEDYHKKIIINYKVDDTPGIEWRII